MSIIRNRLNNTIKYVDELYEQLRTIASQPDDSADANNKCPQCGEPEPVFCCENCGYRWFMPLN